MPHIHTFKKNILILRLFCFCPGILEVIDPLTGHRQHQLCSSQGPMEFLSRCPLECPFPSASALQLRSRLLITGLQQWLFWLTQAARWMHTAALWWRCFLEEAFNVLYSEWRLESLVQRVALGPSWWLTLLPQSKSLPLQTVVNAPSCETCFPGWCYVSPLAIVEWSFSPHPCFCPILQHLIQGASLLECHSWFSSLQAVFPPA